MRICVLLQAFSHIKATANDVVMVASMVLQILEGNVKDPFIRNWLDLLCFLLSGLPADGTIAAEVAFMFNEW